MAGNFTLKSIKAALVEPFESSSIANEGTAKMLGNGTPPSHM